MKRNENRHLWKIMLPLAIIPVAAFLLFPESENGYEVRTCRAELGTITESIPAYGTVRPLSEIRISPDVSGEITDIMFKEGDKVRKGDLLIKIKPDIYQSLQKQAEAALNSAKASYFRYKAIHEHNQMTYRRDSILYCNDAIPLSEYEKSRSEYLTSRWELESAEYNTLSARAALDEALENLSKTSIYAPMDGIISRMSVEEGERVVGTSQMAGTEMLRIADFSAMEVHLKVNENDITRLDKGDTADISVDAYPEYSFKGIVTQIATSSENDGTSMDQIVNYDVRLLITDSLSEGPDEGRKAVFKPGMSAYVKIHTERRKNIITLPIECVTTRKVHEFSGAEDVEDDGTYRRFNEFIFVTDGKKARLHRVQTGIQDYRRIEIKEGIRLEDSLMIISGPYKAISEDLHDGSNIIIINE